jgi:hypothetical protein
MKNFSDPALQALAEPVKRRLIKATGDVKFIPDVTVGSKSLSNS